jgi:hypothetical protein
MAWLPFSVIQAAGRADLTGKLHLAEVPVHLAIMILFVRLGGVEGCALATLLLAFADAAVVVWLAAGVFRRSGLAIRSALLGLAGIVAILGACSATPLWLRLAWSGASLALLGLALWRWYLSDLDRRSVRAALARVWPAPRTA